MKFAEIYKTQNDGSQRIIAVCRLVGEKAVCEGDKAFVENLKKDGIPDYPKQLKPLFPKDGINFLTGLRLAFRSGYLIASDIKEGPEIK